MKELQAMIMRLTGLNEGEYEQIVFEGGIEYAEKFTYGNSEMRRRLTATKMYWDWWKNVWSSLDANFLGSYKFYNTVDAETLLRFYKGEHNPDILQLKPNSLVFKEILKVA
jgi:hypothetical protein